MKDNPIKRAVTEMAFKPFVSGNSHPDLPKGYDLVSHSNLSIEVKVMTSRGPRHFVIRVQEAA